MQKRNGATCHMAMPNVATWRGLRSDRALQEKSATFCNIFRFVIILLEIQFSFSLSEVGFSYCLS